MKREELVTSIRAKKSCLCVGLDTDLEKIPEHLHKEDDPLFAFNRAIIDATAAYAVAFKPNLAFYEQYGLRGWQSFERTVRYLKENYPDQFLIADAKRGDIGNTASKYARAFYHEMGCDAVTVAPYMGEDNVKPFLGTPGKWAIVLGLTSNPGASDVELLELQGGGRVYETVMDKVAAWSAPDELMFVVGATRPEKLREIRLRFPDHFFLVPGVGAQGGTVEEVMEAGRNADTGLLINASRSILYASFGPGFAEAAATEAAALQKAMLAYF